jgi:hypothetical protein
VWRAQLRQAGRQHGWPQAPLREVAISTGQKDDVAIVSII